MLSIHVAYVDTDMSAGADAAKSDPADVVRQVLDGVEKGDVEILADDFTRTVRASRSRPDSPRSCPSGQGSRSWV